MFFSPFNISLGDESANLSAFRTFVRFALVWFCLFPLPFGIWEGLRFVIIALPGLFSYLKVFLPLSKAPRMMQTNYFLTDYQKQSSVEIIGFERDSSYHLLICISVTYIFDMIMYLP